MRRALFAAVLVACAPTTPGAQPHDMSVAGHEAAARSAEQTAMLYQAQYSLDASTKTEHCGRSDFTYGTGVAAPACWTSTTNPTRAYLEEARRYREIAAEHRAASQALRDAEARACAGLSDDDRDISPFAHREDILSVAPLRANMPSARGQHSSKAGALITFRASPSMTAAWLQRLVDCHIARNAALGHDAPDMAWCPLALGNVSAHVTETSEGLAVAVASDDPDTAAEILRRARSLVVR